MARWSPQFGNQQPLSANDIGRQSLPLMQPTITSPFRSQFTSTVNPERPFSEVGKMSINLGAPGQQAGQNVQAAKGFFTGIGAGIGRGVGGIFGKEGGDIGGGIGEFIGGITQVPLDVGANIVGHLPAIPGLPGYRTPGAMLAEASPEQRQKLMEGWDGNPLSLMGHLQDADKQEWARRTDRGGDITPMLRDVGPVSTLGEQIEEAMALIGVGSNVTQRTLGNLGDEGQGTIDRIMAGRAAGPDDPLNAVLSEEVLALREDYANGVITKDRFLDELVLNNAGYSNHWGVNLAMSMVLDPLLLFGGGAGALSKAAMGAKFAKAGKFVKMIGPEAYGELSARVGARVEAQGVGEVTNAIIMDEAKAMGIHTEALAEARAQLGARQRWLDEYATPLEPIYGVAKAINDPISMIGRRGSQPVRDAWLTAQATRAAANAFNIGNFRHVQSGLEKLGKLDKFNRAMGYFVAQEGMFMQGEMVGRDVMATRQLVDARPTTVARAQLKAGSQNYARQLEAFIGRRKVDITQSTGLGTRAMREAAARETITTKLSKMADISTDEARDIVKGLDIDGLSMMDAAYYGFKIEQHNLAVRGAREALAAQVAEGGKGSKGAGKSLAHLDRASLIGPREITTGRAGTLRGTLESDAPLADKAKAGREAIRTYDRMAFDLIADGPTDAEVVTSVLKWLDDWESTLTSEMTPAQVNLLPQSVRDSIDPEDGYIYGMRPEGEAEWRTKQDPDDPNKVVSSNPWMDTVGDAAAPWNTRFSNDTRIGTMMNALDRAVGAMSHQVSTERIFHEARRDFIAKGMDGYVPGQKTALTHTQANDLWKSVLTRAQEMETTPRGMGIRQFEQVLEKNPAVAASGITARDLMGMTLHSFEGRLGTVGVTQKFTGMAKTIGGEVPILPSNLLGQMAERMYPMVRFAYNPFFQLQEWIEPWIFAAARGKQARLTGGWIDPITGVHVDATDVMRQQDYLIDRYKAANPYAEFDMMERSLVYLHGSKAAKEAAKTVEGGRIERARELAMSARSTYDRKVIAQSEMFRHFLGPILKDQLNSINPRAWAELEMMYQTSDMGTIALRWLTEKDVWAATDPKVAHYATEAVRARHIGATARVNLDATAQHSFKTTREALVLSVREGALGLDEFTAKLRDIGAHQTFIDNTWKTLQFEAKTGGMDAFWEQGVKGPTNPLGRPKSEIAKVREVFQVLADAHGIEEVELAARFLSDHILTIMQDDLLKGLETDFAGLEHLLQQADYADSNWFGWDPVTGGLVHQHLDEAEAEARFLAGSQTPPSDLPVEQHGAYNDMQKVKFGVDSVDAEGNPQVARTLFIPGGEAALRDTSKPFTAWEAHLIRNQLVDPNELRDPALRHALYMKMWAGHTIDMADPANRFMVYNNTVMAMLSAGLNLTRNELVSTRLRVTSLKELNGLAAEVTALKATIARTLPEGEAIKAGDLGLAYSTQKKVANYIPLDAVDDYAASSYRTGGQAEIDIKTRARQASGYLENADRPLHEKTMRAAAQRDAVAAMEVKADKAIVAARKSLDEVTAGGDEAAIAKAQATLAEKQAVREAIDPEQALRDIEEADELAIEMGDEKAIAEAERRAEKAVGRISEWAVDQATEVIGKRGVVGLRDLPAEYGVPRAILKDVEQHGPLIEAAGRLAENPEDLVARDVIRALVPGAQKVDNNIAWKKWNINGAGDPHIPAAPDGKPSGHGDADIFAYIKNDEVKWRGFSTNGNIGNALSLAEDMAANPHHYARRRGAQYGAAEALEPLDEFAERLSHRTRGLSLKTGYFGVDLGDPIAFNRGVMDTHMVGDLTEWLYYDVTNKGTDPRWGEFLASLTPGKRKQIEGWLDRRWVRVPEKDPVTGLETGTKVEVPHPEGAPRGAGTYDWSEAAGKNLSLKGPKGVTDGGTVTERAAYIRQRITKSGLTEGQKTRLFRMYSTDEELAELYGRNIKVLGGDYAIYDDLMAERKAIEEAADPSIAEYGHGGYQWKLWDERRKVWDPETSAFAGAHGVKPMSTRALATSDDLHRASGFYDTGGLRSVANAGYRFLDPMPTVMTQKQGHLLRGATIFQEKSEAIIAITEHANASTLVHELAHAVLEPMLDPSGKNVVLENINALIRQENEALTASLDETRVFVDDLDTAVRDAHATMQSAEVTATSAAKDVKPKVAAARQAERDAKALSTAAAEQRGKVKALSADVVSKRKAINAQKMPPSKRASRLAAVDRELARETRKLDTLTAQHEATEASVAPLWDEANSAQELAATTAADLKTATGEWKARVGEYDAKKAEYEGLVTSAPRSEKVVWDEEVSEHFAQEYEVWLRTGKAKNPKMRDAMAYFHRVLQKLEAWLKRNPQVKVSAQMQDLFDRMHTPQVQESVLQANTVPFDATQQTMHAAGVQSVIDAEDAAFTNVQFRRGRSWAERSLNHPYFGLYPFSYMWGKVVPEMVRALAINPFGLPIPGMLEGATPGLGFVNAQRVWNAVELQKDTDPEFRKFMNDPRNDKMFRGAAMVLPATPWDAPANFPLWTRRLAEWGLESNQRVEEGRKPKKFDLFKTASDVTSYAFGPSATLDWLSDIGRYGEAPAISQFMGEGGEEEGTVGALGAEDLVLGPSGPEPLGLP